MSKNKKVEQIIQSDKVYSSDKDNVGNKSTSSSPLHPIEQQEIQHATAEVEVEAETWQPSSIVKTTSQGSSPAGLPATGTPEHMRGAATKDMFDLIERVQCSRIDDQRCSLPAYFSQAITGEYKIYGTLVAFVGANIEPESREEVKADAEKEEKTAPEAPRPSVQNL